MQTGLSPSDTRCTATVCATSWVLRRPLRCQGLLIRLIFGPFGPYYLVPFGDSFVFFFFFVLLVPFGEFVVFFSRVLLAANPRMDLANLKAWPSARFRTPLVSGELMGDGMGRVFYFGFSLKGQMFLGFSVFSMVFL